MTTSAVEPAPPAFDVKNPLTGETLYRVQEPGVADIQNVYRTARQTFLEVRAMPVQRRVDELGKLQKYILENKESIIDRIVAETGKARTEALFADVFITLDAIAYYRKHAAQILADQIVTTPITLMGKKSKIRLEPVGPVLVISPWNFPFHLGMYPCISAFAAGCSVVFKPSEWTPLKGLFEDIFEKSGFVKNAIQVVYGGKEIGQKLIEGGPAKIFFTGSTRAGKAIMAQAAKDLIPVELELGGKDPMIVFDDVNVERTVQGAVWGALTNSGQTCTSVERLYVHERIYSQFVESLTAEFKKIRSAAINGPGPNQGDLDMGGITAPFQLDIIENHIADAVQKGARVLVGGKRGAAGQSFEPTLLVDVISSMKIASEETFGPILPVMKFRDEAEAIALANHSPYGLSSSVWSGDLARAERVAEKLEAGAVCINNVMSTQANPALPFGGVKASGFGRYHGVDGLFTFCNLKSIMIDPKENKREMHWYPYSAEKYRLFSKLIDELYSGGRLGVIKAALLGMKLDKISQKR